MMLVYAFYFTCNIHTITLKKQFIVWKVRKSVILWNRKPHPGSILNIIINMNEIEFKVNLKGKKNLYSSTLTMQYLTNLQFLKYLKQENIRSSCLCIIVQEQLIELILIFSKKWILPEMKMCTLNDHRGTGSECLE